METGNPRDLYHGSVWYRAHKKVFGRGRQNYLSITFKQTGFVTLAAMLFNVFCNSDQSQRSSFNVKMKCSSIKSAATAMALAGVQ